jgi:hypothetical protein
MVRTLRVLLTSDEPLVFLDKRSLASLESVMDFRSMAQIGPLGAIPDALRRSDHPGVLPSDSPC